MFAKQYMKGIRQWTLVDAAMISHSYLGRRPKDLAELMFVSGKCTGNQAVSGA